MSGMKAALRADEWGPALKRGDCEYFAATEDLTMHALAALCLYGQPFGFTREDVEMLRMFASPPDLPPYQPLLNLADRIGALLPPEESK